MSGSRPLTPLRCSTFLSPVHPPHLLSPASSCSLSHFGPPYTHTPPLPVPHNNALSTILDLTLEWFIYFPFFMFFQRNHKYVSTQILARLTSKIAACFALQKLHLRHGWCIILCLLPGFHAYPYRFIFSQKGHLLILLGRPNSTPPRGSPQKLTAFPHTCSWSLPALSGFNLQMLPFLHKTVFLVNVFYVQHLRHDSESISKRPHLIRTP